jgi:hypothetical protein
VLTWQSVAVGESVPTRALTREIRADIHHYPGGLAGDRGR